MKRLKLLVYLFPLLACAAESARHWAELKLSDSAVAAIRDQDTPRITATVSPLSKSGLNAALILACRLGKLESTMVLIKLGANPANVVQHSPAASKESPLQSAIISGNLDLIRYLLTLKGTLHFESKGHLLELGTAASTGQTQATIMVLERVRTLNPGKYQRYLEDAIIVMIWNEQEAAAADIMSKNLRELPETALRRLRKDVVMMDPASSLPSLEAAWKIAKERGR